MGFFGGGGGTGGGPYTVITTTATLESQKSYMVDTSSSAYTITLPATPSNGDYVEIFDRSNSFGTNNLTIDRNGNKIESLTENLTGNINGAAFKLAYADSTTGWQIIPFYGFSGPVLVGANSSTTGTSGVVPSPAAGEQNSILYGDGTFKSPFIRPVVTNWDSGRVYAAFGAENNNLGATSNANIRARFCPIFLPKGSISKFLFLASTAPAANSTGYCALYSSDSTGKPLNVVASGSFSLLTTDSSTVKTITISPSVAIKAGLYYCSYHNNVSGTQPNTRVANRSLWAHQYFFGANSSADEITNNVPYMTITSAGTWPNQATVDGIDGTSTPYFYVEIT